MTKVHGYPKGGETFLLLFFIPLVFDRRLITLAFVNRRGVAYLKFHKSSFLKFLRAQMTCFYFHCKLLICLKSSVLSNFCRLLTSLFMLFINY